MKYLNYIFIGLAILGISSLGYLYKQHQELKGDYSTAIEHIDTLQEVLSDKQDSSKVLKLTIESLNTVNDSIIQKLNDTRRKLKVKDKELQQLQYLLSTTKKTDTIIFRDTIFKDPTVKLDTTLTDSTWYRIGLDLSYPSTIVVSPEFENEVMVTMSLKKDYVEPRKKCWLSRIFQKKAYVMEAVVTESNPYSAHQKQRFIQIIE